MWIRMKFLINSWGLSYAPNAPGPPSLPQRAGQSRPGSGRELPTRDEDGAEMVAFRVEIGQGGQPSWWLYGVNDELLAWAGRYYVSLAFAAMRRPHSGHPRFGRCTKSIRIRLVAGAGGRCSPWTTTWPIPPPASPSRQKRAALRGTSRRWHIGPLVCSRRRGVLGRLSSGRQGMPSQPEQATPAPWCCVRTCSLTPGSAGR